MKLPSVSIFKPTVVRNGKPTKTKIWWMAWRDTVTKKRYSESTGTADKTIARQLANKRQRDFANSPLGIITIHQLPGRLPRNATSRGKGP